MGNKYGGGYTPPVLSAGKEVAEAMVTFTPAARTRIQELIAERQDPDVGLRLYAMPSG